MITRSFPLIVAICFSVSGCWRLADPRGCDDWEIFDYNRGARVWDSECPDDRPCFVYIIAACSSTLDLRFYEGDRLPRSRELQIKTKVSFQKLLQSTGNTLASCDISPKIPPIMLPYGGGKIEIPIFCSNAVIFPEKEPGNALPISIRYFQTIK